MQELELLQHKLEQLLKRFTALEAEKERLHKTLLQQSAVVSNQNEKIKNLENEIKLKSVVLSAGHTTDTENLKVHLDKVIREIEKNIETL